jgi:hypothetical protein
VKAVSCENSELRALLEKEKAQNQVHIERTRAEVERMRDRQDRELKAEGERIVEALQRECAHYRGVNEDVER